MGKTRGLTLGKFAPLHRGHQLLIETALAEVDELLLIIYDCPETTRVPLTVRSHWIRDLYPTVRVIEAWDGPSEVGDTPAIQSMHEDYILNRLQVRGITHFYSSEFYGEHMSAALGARNRLVDPGRTRVPVCASRIRENAYAFREYLAPRVYRDLVANIVFLGAPCTGKTTMAERLAREYGTLWMPEYGREYWEKHHVNRRLSLEQLVEIAEGHLEREEALLPDTNRFLFADTNALTTYVFSRHYHGTAAPRLEEIAELAARRYEVVFLCETDIPYDDTWDRSGDADRNTFQKRVIDDLRTRKIPFFPLRGGIEVRTRQVMRILEGYEKYSNPAELPRIEAKD